LESKSAALVAAVFDGFLRKSVQHAPAGFKGATSKRREGRADERREKGGKNQQLFCSTWSSAVCMLARHLNNTTRRHCTASLLSREISF